MTLATALAELKASLDQGNEGLTTKHFRLLVEALESIQTDGLSMGSANVTGIGRLNLATPTELTIAVGIVSITQAFHTIDTEGDAATDDLNTISGGADGDILIIKPASSSRDIVVKDSSGNLRLGPAGDFTMDSARDVIGFVKNDIGEWLELFRSDNLI